MALPFRQNRVGKQVMRLMMPLLRRRLEPEFSDLELVRVEMSADLSQARLMVRSSVRPEDTREAWIAALNRQAGSLRMALTPELNLKRSPRLRFDYDTHGEAMEVMLRNLSDVDV